MKTRYILNGKEVSRKEWLKGRKGFSVGKPPVACNTYSEHDPLISEGVGVMKSQVGEARKMLKEHNITGAKVLDSGQVRFTSRAARREVLKLRGMHDNDGGYGDG